MSKRELEHRVSLWIPVSKLHIRDWLRAKVNQTRNEGDMSSLSLEVMKILEETYGNERKVSNKKG